MTSTTTPAAASATPGAEVRRSQSSWALGEHEAGLEALRADLASGAWDEHHGHLRALPELDGSLRLVVSH